MSLRSRIPALLAVLVFYPLATMADDTGASYYLGSRCFDWDEEDGNCPSDDEAMDYLRAYQDPADCAITDIDGSATFSNGECCYDVIMEACYDNNGSSCL